MDNEAVFIKPYRSSSDPEELTIERALNNKDNNVDTIIIPDVNVLIAIEKVIKLKPTQESYEKKGIWQIMSFMDYCTKLDIPIYWAPYFAMLEMPGKSASSCLDKLKQFEKKRFKWNDNGSYEIEVDFDKNQLSKEFHLMNEDEKQFLAPSFYCLLLIQLIERDLSKLSPFDKLLAYLNLVESNIDILSFREFLIATLIFSPQSDKDNSKFKKLKKDVCENFGFKKQEKMKDSDLRSSMIKKATNGARDLSYLYICCILSNNSTENRDVWLATRDLKLVAFNKFYYNIGSRGKMGEIILTDLFDNDKNSFFFEALNEFSSRTSNRANKASSISITEDAVKSCNNLMNLIYRKLKIEDIPLHGKVEATEFNI